MKRFYSFFAAVILLLTASNVKAHDFINETVQEGVKYYLLNNGNGKFLNNNNGFDETPVTAWTIDMENAAISADGKFINCTRTGRFVIDYKYNWTSNASTDAVTKIEDRGGYYSIITEFSLGSFASCFLTANGDGLTNSIGVLNQNWGPEAQWLFVSDAQYKRVTTAFDAMPVATSEFAEGEFYIFNPISGMYLSTDEGSLTSSMPTLWTIAANEEGLYTLTSGQNSVTATMGLLSATVNTGTDAASAFTVEGDDRAYTFSTVLKPLVGDARTYYLSVENKFDFNGDDKIIASQDGNIFAKWVLFSKKDYEASGKIREDAIVRLKKAVDAGKEADKLPMPNALKRAGLNFLSDYNMNSRLNKATDMYNDRNATKVVSLFPYRTALKYDANDFIGAAEKLEEITAAVLDVTDTYAACKDAADHIQAIPGVGAAISGFLGDKGLEITTTKEAMINSVQAMRTAALVNVLLPTTVFKAGDDLTGLIQNHSFDTGDATGWRGLTGDLNAASTAVLTDGMANGVGKYHFESNIFGLLGANTGERIIQPVIGLKKGDYSLKVKAASLSTLSNKIHLNAIVIPTDLIDITHLDDPTALIGDILKNITNIISRGIIKEASKDCPDKNNLEEVELQFTLDAADPIIIAMNCGLTSATGFNAFAADEVTLTYLGEGVITDINTVNAATGADTYYNIGGSAVAAPAKGINIQRTADGKVKKFIVK